MKTVRIFFDRIRDRIRLEGFRSVRIRVRIFNIRYRIRIRILKSYNCDVDIQSYLIRHGWYYPYSNPNSTRNMKTNIILMIFVRIRSVFIPRRQQRNNATHALGPFVYGPYSCCRGQAAGLSPLINTTTWALTSRLPTGPENHRVWAASDGGPRSGEASKAAWWLERAVRLCLAGEGTEQDRNIYLAIWPEHYRPPRHGTKKHDHA